MSSIAASVFRAYDIRGDAAKYLDNTFCEKLAAVIAIRLRAAGQAAVIIGRDGRNSSPRIHGCLRDALLGNGIDVFDLGLVPTPMVQFGREWLGVNSSLMVTGSHNPPADNGVKMVLDGETLSARSIASLRDEMLALPSLRSSRAPGRLNVRLVFPEYLRAVKERVNVARPLKLVLDCGNGATAPYAKPLFEALGCEVSAINDSIDGDFPGHPPDPSIVDNLQQLQAAVRAAGADLGIAFDGDGDRVAAVSARGACPGADQLLMLLADELLGRSLGAVVFDIKSSRAVRDVVLAKGGQPVLSRSGHSYMKRAMQDSGALLGAELSGHVFYRHNWYGFDDGLYAAARLVELLAGDGACLDDRLVALPRYLSTPELRIALPEQDKFATVAAMIDVADFRDAELTTLDGLRVDFPEGWGLVRASNTGPALTLRFEAECQESLEGIQSRFAKLLKSARPGLALPFSA